MSYAELTDTLQQHYSPAPSEIVERFKFYSRSRRAGESVADFLAQMRSLAQHCNYGASLDTMLRDRLVCGINEDSIQKRLLAEPNLTYKKAVELARGLETADRNAQLLKNNHTIKRDPSANQFRQEWSRSASSNTKESARRCDGF